jgi:hypothetical protein
MSNILVFSHLLVVFHFRSHWMLRALMTPLALGMQWSRYTGLSQFVLQSGSSRLCKSQELSWNTCLRNVTQQCWTWIPTRVPQVAPLLRTRATHLLLLTSKETHLERVLPCCDTVKTARQYLKKNLLLSSGQKRRLASPRSLLIIYKTTEPHIPEFWEKHPAFFFGVEDGDLRPESLVTRRISQTYRRNPCLLTYLLTPCP